LHKTVIAQSRITYNRKKENTWDNNIRNSAKNYYQNLRSKQ